MRRSYSPFIIAVLLCASNVTGAQTPAWVTQLLLASDLPVVTLEARREGVPSRDIRQALDAMRDKNVPAHDARLVIVEARTARREHGPVDNFGAFVQSKLDAGLRGRELAAAIRAEHAARGVGSAGQSKGVGQSKGQSQTKGQSETKGQTQTKGQSEAKGQSRAKAPPPPARANTKSKGRGKP